MTTMIKSADRGPSQPLERAIAAKRDPRGGKVLLPLDVAEALLKALRQ